VFIGIVYALGGVIAIVTLNVPQAGEPGCLGTRRRKKIKNLNDLLHISLAWSRRLFDNL
jgi:hypothetical protein